MLISCVSVVLRTFEIEDITGEGCKWRPIIRLRDSRLKVTTKNPFDFHFCCHALGVRTVTVYYSSWVRRGVRNKYLFVAKIIAAVHAGRHLI